MRIPGVCEVCEAPTDWGICGPCERAMIAAAQRDREQGIESRCPECYEPDGFHLEGQCSHWSDDYGRD